MAGLLNVPQGGVPVPGVDAWKLPNGQYSPMTPMQIMMRDLMGPFTGGMAGQSGQTVSDYNTRLKRELDKIGQ